MLMHMQLQAAVNIWPAAVADALHEMKSCTRIRFNA